MNKHTIIQVMQQNEQISKQHMYVRTCVYMYTYSEQLESLHCPQALEGTAAAGTPAAAGEGQGPCEGRGCPATAEPRPLAPPILDPGSWRGHTPTTLHGYMYKHVHC